MTCSDCSHADHCQDAALMARVYPEPDARKCQDFAPTYRKSTEDRIIDGGVRFVVAAFVLLFIVIAGYGWHETFHSVIGDFRW